MTSQENRVVAITFGVAFVLLVLAVAILVPDPTGFQHFVFRIVLGLAAAGVAATMPGAISVDVGTSVRASGALTVFVLVYFFNPTQLVTETVDAGGPRAQSGASAVLEPLAQAAVAPEPLAGGPVAETATRALVPPAPAASAPSLRTGGSAAAFGVIQLGAGFLPDPHEVSVVAGGSLTAAEQVSGCAGYVAADPDVVLHWSGSSELLRIFVLGEGDTTLAIHDPSGAWYCNDDSFGTLHPTVDFAAPRPGQYDIWVGSYSPGVRLEGQLMLTEMQSMRPDS